MRLQLSSPGLRAFSVGSLRRRVGVLVVAAVVVSFAGAVTDPASAAPSHKSAATPTTASSAAKVATRPDLVSAQVTARAQGSRVEVESLRSETSTTWVNPDGTLTTQEHQAPIRFRDPAAKSAANPQGWRSVDLTMSAAADGTVAPKADPLGLSLAGAGHGADRGASAAAGTDLAAAHERPGRAKQARQVTLGWTGKLGAPTLDSTKATYKDVKPGVDLLVDARRTGFEQQLVFNSRAALDAWIAQAAPGNAAWTIPVKTRGLTARADSDGSVAFVDTDGQVASRVDPPVAWDAAVDPHSGDHANTSAVPMTVAQSGAGKAVLTLTPDLSWLQDSARVFPVTIDPTYASTIVTTNFDTYVSSAFPTATYSTSTELHVGTYNAGGDKNRAILNFPITTMHGKVVESASLSLYEFYSYSCTAKPFNVYSVPATSNSSTNWNNQPGAVTQYGTLTTAKGYSSACAAGRVSVPVTGLAKAYAAASASTASIQLSASDTDSGGWKKFYSLESSEDPYLTYTYNRNPNLASAPTLQSPPGVSYVNPSSHIAYLYTSDSKPKLSTTATDPDGNGYFSTIEIHNSTTVSSTSLVTSCNTPKAPYTASGATASCIVPVALTDSAVYYARASVGDDQGAFNGGWSPWTTFRTAIGNPKPPTISCPGYADSSWTVTLPGSAVDCTISAAGTGTTAPAYVKYSLDGAAYVTKAITPSSDPATASFHLLVPNTAGSHSIQAISQSVTSMSSGGPVSYGFGYGPAGLTGATAVPLVTTTGLTKITAAGPPRGSSAPVTAKLRWRSASSGNDSSAPYWNDATSAPLTVTDNGASGVAVAGSWNTAAETVDATVDSDPNTAGIQPTTLNPRVPVLLELQVCVTYTNDLGTQCTWSQNKSDVMRLPHAFGNGFPTATAGPGQVALFTGEFNTDVTDASVPGYTGTISLSRSHSTYGNDPSTPTDAVTGIFGPGWTASLQGSDAGQAGLQAIDSTRTDGTIDFLDTDGSALVFLAPGTAPRRTTAADLTAGTYKAADDDTAQAGITLTVAGTGAGTTLTLTEDDGTKTVFQPQTAAQAPTATTPGLFTPKSVTEPGSLTTTYTRDNSGRVTRILAPVPPGTVTATGRTVTCPDGPVSGMDKGCRALRISYGDGTSATGNTPTGQAWQVTAELYNPTAIASADCAGNSLTLAVGMVSIPMACYSYDSANRLASVKDPRTGLATGYTYGSSNQLATITPAGQSSAPITLNYSSLEQRLKLTSVTRPQAAPLTGTATLAQFVYNAPLSGAGLPAPGLPDLTASAVGAWAQAKPATYAAAVFGPDYSGTITQASGNTLAAASDWSYADLSYTDAAGYTVNTANYGANAWQRTATDYDDQGNVVRQLNAGAINAITAGAVDPGTADLYATKTIYNTDIKNTATPTPVVVTPAGTLVTDTYGPIRNAVMADGTTMAARPHSHTTYDEGAPNQVNGVGINPATNAPWRLATTQTTTASDGSGVDIAGQTVSTTTTDYTAQVTGTADGWALGSPTKVTTAGISKITAYDSAGRVIQTRQPLSSGSDAGTTNTVYYTADSSATDSRCADTPEWAGLPCATGPAAVPATSGTPADGPASLPSSLTTRYSLWLAATTAVETSGTASRTTTSTPDVAGRVLESETTSNIPNSAPRDAVYTHYDPATGQADYTGTSDLGTAAITDARKTIIFDAWGRATTTRAETPTPGVYDTTVTTYDSAGRVATVTDPKGTTTTTWDGTDALGRTEHRGLATKMTISRGGTAGGTLDSTGAYDANGTLTVQKLPGAITQTTTLDAAGEPTGLAYDGQVTPVTQQTDANNNLVYDANGNPVYNTGTPTTGTWMAWTQANDISGRVREQYTGAGSSFDQTATVATSLDQVVAPTGNAIAYDRSYTYDGAGRLTTVLDRTALATGTTMDPSTTPSAAAPCTVRAYSFDGNGRRTQLVTGTRNNGDCTATADTTTTATYAYDSADRPTTGANGTGTYAYDAFGRQTLIPAVDAPKSAVGNITLGYYDDDLAYTIKQNGVTTTLALDSGGRRIKSSTDDGAGTTLERHYSDGSDNPAWTVKTSGGVSITTRYAESLGGDLGASIGADGSATLDLATLHGDVATAVDLAATHDTGTPCTGIDGWSDYTEYGAPRDPTATDTVDGDAGYGWLGAKERSTTTETAGLTLMGVRLYDSTTGRFASVDPILGGNDNAYNYPNDPINGFDLTGKCWSGFGWACKSTHWAANRWRHSAAIRLVVGMGVTAIAGMACGPFAVACATAASAAYSAFSYHVLTPRRQRSMSGYFLAAAKGAMTTLTFRMHITPRVVSRVAPVVRDFARRVWFHYGW